jgi:hypothetical protein
MEISAHQKSVDLGKRIAPTLFTKKHSLDPRTKRLAEDIFPINFGRSLVLAEFISQISSTFELGSKLKVAVLGGSALEPEIIALERLGFTVELRIFGIEKDSENLNLNVYSEEKFDSDFDLILCSQVWEHIWCHVNAFKNILRIIPGESLLWLACPTSNRAHASPDYFCAGFTQTYFINNLNRIGFTVVASGQLGTARNYRATHTMPIWLTVKSHKFPILHTFPEYKIATRIALVARYFLRNFELFFFSPKITSDDAFATETWVFARKV